MCSLKGGSLGLTQCVVGIDRGWIIRADSVCSREGGSLGLTQYVVGRVDH